MFRNILLGGSLVLLLTACAKNEIVRPGSAALVIINGIPGSNLIRTSFSTSAPTVFYSANVLVYASFTPSGNLYYPTAGSVPLNLYNQPDTLPKSIPLYSLSLDLPEGSIHSLFLTGSISAPESVLVKDEVPYYPAADSAMGVRFVNLLADNVPVHVNLVSKPPGSELSELSYKGVTAFKKYPVKMDIADYVFEFRHATTGAVIASYTTRQIANNGKLTPNSWVYKKFALALVGRLNATGTQAPRILLIPYSRTS